LLGRTDKRVRVKMLIIKTPTHVSHKICYGIVPCSLLASVTSREGVTKSRVDKHLATAWCRSMKKLFPVTSKISDL